MSITPTSSIRQSCANVWQSALQRNHERRTCGETVKEICVFSRARRWGMRVLTEVSDDGSSVAYVLKQSTNTLEIIALPLPCDRCSPERLVGSAMLLGLEAQIFNSTAELSHYSTIMDLERAPKLSKHCRLPRSCPFGTSLDLTASRHRKRTGE